MPKLINVPFCTLQNSSQNYLRCRFRESEILDLIPNTDLDSAVRHDSWRVGDASSRPVVWVKPNGERVTDGIGTAHERTDLAEFSREIAASLSNERDREAVTLLTRSSQVIASNYIARGPK